MDHSGPGRGIAVTTTACGSQTDIDSRKHLHVTVGSDGRFSKQGTLRFKAPQGPTVEGQFELQGRLKSGKASGTYRGSGQAQLSDGSSLTCDTGTIKWSARRS